MKFIACNGFCGGGAIGDIAKGAVIELPDDSTTRYWLNIGHIAPFEEPASAPAPEPANPEAAGESGDDAKDPAAPAGKEAAHPDANAPDEVANREPGRRGRGRT